MNATRRWIPAIVVLGLVLGGCATAATETAVPEADSEPSFVPVVSATGKVVPQTWASLSLPSAGVVGSLEVVEGDEVGEGKVLLQLSGREQLQAALATARLEELAARQALDQVYLDSSTARAIAQQNLATARDELRKAEYDRTVQQEGYRASDDTIDRARANVVIAQGRVDEARAAYDSISGSPYEDTNKAQALTAYLGAKAALTSAKRSYNWYTGHPTEIQQAMLDADVALAQAVLEEAEQAWNDVQDGPDPDAVAMAKARLAAAQAAVAAAEASLANTELRAPFGGTVSAVRVRPNEWAAPGMPLIDLANLDRLQIETTDLSEIDVARVAIGAPATITFDALPEAQVTGRVVRIAPKATEGSGVNYTLWIEMDEIPDGLLWGMTAFVDIEGSP